MDLGPDEFVTSFTEVREHEKHVDGLFAKKEQRIEQLEGAIREAVGLLTPPLVGSEPEMVLKSLKEVLG